MSLHFRVFLSSTFADFRQERDILNLRVFPEVRRYAGSRGLDFQSVDLRWGVPLEATASHSTADICRQEVRRCRDAGGLPFFLGLLGQRSGWRPCPEAIPAPLFERLTAKPPSEGPLVPLLMNHWYQLDSNAIPPAYRLRNLDGEDARVWLRDVAIPIRAFLDETLPDYADASLQRVLSGSLTEIETLEAFGESRPDGLRFYVRHIAGLDHIARDGGHPPPALDPYVDRGTDGRIDEAGLARALALRDDVIRRIGPSAIRRFEAAIHDDGLDPGYLQAFESAVTEDLKAAIDATRIPQPAPGHIHQEFAERLGSEANTQGRSGDIDRLVHLVGQPLTGPVFVVGPSGIGKTAVMAAAALRLAAGAAICVPRFVGASARSMSVRALVDDVHAEVAGQATPARSPVDAVTSVIALFARTLNEASPDRHFVILLDGVDQLIGGGDAPGVTWIPRQTPPHVRLVVSIAHDGRSIAALARALSVSEEQVLRIGAIPADAGEAILNGLLTNAAHPRRLTSSQHDEVRRGLAACPWPLFVHVAAAIVHAWRSGDDGTLPSGPDEQSTLTATIDELFRRLDEPGRHVPGLPRAVLGAIAAMRHGLNETELLEALPHREDFYQAFRALAAKMGHPISDAAPAAPWSLLGRLREDLGALLVTGEHGGVNVIAFRHEAVARAARRRYLDGVEGRRTRVWLAEYFSRRPLRGPTGTVDARTISETPWHWIHAGVADRVFEQLTNLAFLEAKAAAAVLELLADFELALPVFDERDQRRTALAEIGGVIRDHANLFRQQPDLVFQYCFNERVARERAGEPGNGIVHHTLEDWRREKERTPGFHWLRALHVERAAPARAVTVLRGHDAAVFSVAFTPDGRRLITGGADSRIIVWDWRTGVRIAHFGVQRGGITALAVDQVRERVLAAAEDSSIYAYDLPLGTAPVRLGRAHSSYTLGAPPPRNGHSGPVTDLTVDSSHTWLVSASSDRAGEILSYPDRTLRIWNVSTLRETGILAGHQAPVWRVVLTRDGRRAISCAGGEDTLGGLRAWSISSDGQGSEIGQAQLGTDAGSLCLFDHDRLIAVGGADGVVQVFDCDPLTRVRSITGGGAPVTDITASPDASVLAIATLAGRVRVLAPSQDDRILDTFDVPGRAARVAFSPCGQYLAIAAGDGSTHVVHLSSPGASPNPPGEDDTGPFGEAHVSANARWFASYSGATVRVFDASTGALTRTLRASGPITDIDVSATGLVAVGCSDSTAHVWRSDDAQVILRDNDHQSWVGVVRFSPDGARLAVGSSQTLKVFDVAGAGPALRLDGPAAMVLSVAWSADGRLLYAAGGGEGDEDSVIRCWEAGTGALLRTIPGHRSPVKALALSPDGALVASGSHCGIFAEGLCDVGVWLTGDGEALSFFNLPDEQMVTAIAVANGGALLAVKCDRRFGYAGDREIRGSGNITRTYVFDRGHVRSEIIDGDITIDGLAADPNGLVGRCSFTSTVIQRANQVLAHAPGGDAIAATPDGSRWAVSAYGRISIYALEGQDPLSSQNIGSTSC